MSARRRHSDSRSDRHSHKRSHSRHSHGPSDQPRRLTLRVHPEFHRHLLIVCVAVILSWVLSGPWVQLSHLGFIYMTVLLGLRLGPFGAVRFRPSRLNLLSADTHYLLLAVATTIAQLVWLLSPVSLRYSGLPLLTLFTLFIAWSMLRLLRVLGAEKSIDLRTLCGATAGYLLLGISGGLLLTVLDSVLPGGFRDNLTGQVLSMPPVSLIGSDRIDWDVDYGRLNYFAFVSLTTLGYGDITPVLPPTRLACLLLSVLGPLYIAVVLGVLISRLSVNGAGPQHGSSDDAGSGVSEPLTAASPQPLVPLESGPCQELPREQPPNHSPGPLPPASPSALSPAPESPGRGPDG